MQLVLAHINVKKEFTAEFLNAFSAYQEKITSFEIGTIAFDLYEDDQGGGAYTIVEMYRDESAYQDHVKSPWRDEALAVIRSTLSNSSASRHRLVNPTKAGSE